MAHTRPEAGKPSALSPKVLVRFFVLFVNNVSKGKFEKE
jgi:hypothetical protein